MSKMNNLSFELNSKTPLSARWAQMTKQEQIIEKKRLEILAKMEAQKKAKTKSGEPKTPATVNKFSNDGSFMDQFKKMSEQNKGGKKPDQVQNKPAESERNEQKDIDRPQGSNNDKHREDTRGRGGEDREDRYRSSSGHRSRDRSRSPRWENRRDKWDRNGRQDYRDNRNRRWESGSRHSRRRSSSPSTPVVEDMMSRKSRYSNPHDRSNSFPPRPSNFPPSNNSPMHCNSPVPPMGNPPNLPPGLPFQSGNNFPHMSNAPPFLDNFNMPGNGPLPPPQNSPFMPNMPPFGNNNPPMQMPMNMPGINSGPMNFPNSPNPLMPQGLPCPPGQMNMNQNFPQVPPNNSNLPNMGAPPNFNQMMPPNTLPSLMNPNNLSGLNQNLNLPCPPFNPSLGPPNLNQPGLINVQGPPMNMPHPMNNLNRGPMNMQGPVGNPNMQCPINMPNMIPPNLQGSMNRPNLQEPNLQLLAPIAYPNIKPQGPFNKNIPPPLNVPLHTIPEPKPLDTLSIPPPKPLDAVKIPPPAPLEAVKIPPPKPMNLQTIPPPLPICLTQIPKPKELDVCSIPPPPSSTVLSPDNPRTSAMEAVASQVARAGDQLEEMLKSQCEQDSSIWFLQDETTADYKMYRELVFKYRNKMHHPNDMKIETEDTRDEDNYKCVPDDEKYEPEFSLQDDSSGEESEDVKCDINKEIKEESNSKEKSEEEWQESEYEDVKRFVKEKSVSGSDSETETDMKKERRERRERKRKSRWGEESSAAAVGNTMIGVPGMANITSLGGVVPFPPTPAVLPLSGEKAQLSRVTRQDPGLLQYALKSYGTTSLSDEDWLKCEDHYKISLLYQEMLRKRHEVEQLAASGRHKYEYDSDEEVDGGTWEHRLRQQEMEATSRWAGELTRAAAGKHHIGDFLPPHELKRFMDKYTAVKGGKEPDLSDYKEFKLKEDNIGFKMLQKLGWSEGEGLGVDKSGIVDPVNKASSRESNQGLGVDRGDNLEEGDDEFDAYRKRMMLAYRFRPNPLNNPRRPYY